MYGRRFLLNLHLKAKAASPSKKKRMQLELSGYYWPGVKWSACLHPKPKSANSRVSRKPIMCWAS